MKRDERHVMDAALATSTAHALWLRERKLMDQYRDQLMVNSPNHRPPKRRYFLPSRLVTNASPTGSSHPFSKFFYSGRTS